MGSLADEELLNFSWLERPFKLRIQVDFEKERKLVMGYSPANEDNFTPILSVAGIHSMVDMRSNYFSMQVFLGKKSTFLINLNELRVSEKARRLDVSENLVVSEYLAEEIFQKVRQFSDKFEKDQTYLKTIYDGYSSALAKTNQFQTIVVDLFKGSRKLEESVIESISRLSSMNPETLPKMMRIKAYFETIMTKQTRLFDRFNGAKDFGKLKQILRKFRGVLKRMEKAITNINESLASAEFDGLFGRVTSVMDVLKRLSFKDDLEGIRRQIKGIRERAKETNSWGMLGLIAFGVFLFAGSMCIFNAIKKAES